MLPDLNYWEIVFELCIYYTHILVKCQQVIVSEVMIMSDMTMERAIANAIASIEMEGFVVTDKHKELITKLMNKEMTLEDALKELNNDASNRNGQ